MSAIATSAPARASVSASARPRPREPPVTSATRPERSISTAIGRSYVGRAGDGHPAPRRRASGWRDLRDDQLRLRGVPRLARDPVDDLDANRDAPARVVERALDGRADAFRQGGRGSVAEDDADEELVRPMDDLVLEDLEESHERRTQAVGMNGHRPAVPTRQREDLVA